MPHSPQLHERQFLKDVGAQILTLDLQDICQESFELQKHIPIITDFKPITSYSWIDSQTPTIVVPGLEEPVTVSLDDTATFIDKASALLPDSPLLPMLEAIRFNEPLHDFGQYDVNSGRGDLKKLLSWVDNTAREKFRIDIERQENGCITLRRWEASDSEHAGRSLSYRVNFEDATFVRAVDEPISISHQRVLGYNLGTLRMLVGCEVDAFGKLQPRTYSILKRSVVTSKWTLVLLKLYDSQQL